MLAYHSDPALKERILAQLAQHREADEIIKGKYWEGGKGCAVGCTIHGSDHAEYEPRFGIPQMLAHLEDRIFEGLPNADAKLWPERFMGAIRPGADLSTVGWKFLHWLLTVKLQPHVADSMARAAVARCAVALEPLTRGEPVDSTAAEAAARAARAAWAAARAAEAAARAAQASWASAAARAAQASWASAAAQAAEASWASWASAAARAAEASWAAADAAWAAACAAAWAAAWEADAARAASYQRQADQLISLLEAA